MTRHRKEAAPLLRGDLNDPHPEHATKGTANPMIARAPKPKPPVLTPEQEARAIDLLNEQARTLTAPKPQTAPKPKPAGGAR